MPFAEGPIEQDTRILPLTMREAAVAILMAAAAADGALAVELVFVDGDVSATETRFVDSLKSALAIDDEIAANIIEVLLIKSRA